MSAIRAYLTLLQITGFLTDSDVSWTVRDSSSSLDSFTSESSSPAYDTGARRHSIVSSNSVSSSLFKLAGVIIRKLPEWKPTAMLQRAKQMHVFFVVLSNRYKQDTWCASINANAKFNQPWPLSQIALKGRWCFRRFAIKAISSKKNHLSNLADQIHIVAGLPLPRKRIPTFHAHIV